jgi:tetratricopeptide (TPR) repeat protein
MELGKDSFDLRKGQVDTLVRMALDGAPKPSDMANLAKEHQAIKLYFLAATLDSLKDLPAERRIGVLDSLIEQKLDETPWGMPPDCVLLVQFHRGKTYQSLGEKDQTCLVKALADFRGAASAAPRWPWGKEATEKAAQLLYGMKEYAQAASLYRAYLAEVPYAEDRALVLLNEGKCLLMLQDYATALQRFSQAVSEHPADAMADKAGKYRQYALKKLGAANAGSGPPDPPAAPAPAQP